MATAPTPTLTGMDKLQSDWNNNTFWANEAGKTVNFANGSITRGQGDTANYKAFGDTGAGYTFNKGQSVDSVANGSEDIANAWKGAYGVDARGTPTKAAPVFNLKTSGLQGAGTWTVDPATQTVQGQLQNLLNKDNPIMAQARTRALQSQNANGTLNSSMAAEAGESAVIGKGIEIATPDARMYGDAAKFGVEQSNLFARDANDRDFQGQMANFNLGANEWAAERLDGRTRARDAINNTFTAGQNANNNAFTSARDAAAVAATAARDVTQNQFTADQNRINDAFTSARDAAAVAATAARDVTQNQFTADQNRINDELTVARDTNNAKVRQQEQARLDVTNAKSAFQNDLVRIQTSDMEPADKTALLKSLLPQYNSIIRNSMTVLGITDESWLLTENQFGASTNTNGNDEGGGGSTPTGETRYVDGVVEMWNGSKWVPM
jgi:hypothetical protein